ncbi:MAG TPA: type II secretion system F family protein [Candidatus Paceibacterota bacterium]|nr:type II secretion system F family protein [Candidatus Paceibacterota bacterium]
MNERTRRPLFLRFPVREQILFAKRLAMILRSGVPLREGLLMLDVAGSSRSSGYILTHIIADVSRGTTLSSALAVFERVVGVFAINIIRVGENSGTLGSNLAYLAEELKKRDTLRKKVLGALVYPAIIIIATIGISLVLTVYIFPKITPIFKGFKHQLPFSTRLLIGASSFLLADGVWLIIGSIGVIIIGVFLIRIPRVRRVLDHGILALPIVGRLACSYYLASITRTLSLLLVGGVRIVPALDIIAESIDNIAYREAVEGIAHAVGCGRKLSLEMYAHSTRFPALCAQMVAVGEETGDLQGSLMYIAEMYEEDITDLTRNLTTLLEPVLMLLMGTIVGFIAVSIITPIYGITQDLTLH